MLALMGGEPGEEAVRAVLPGARLSAVNLAEVVSRLAGRGMPAEQAHADALALDVDIVACSTATSRSMLAHSGRSPGAQACRSATAPVSRWRVRIKQRC